LLPPVSLSSRPVKRRPGLLYAPTVAGAPVLVLAVGQSFRFPFCFRLFAQNDGFPPFCPFKADSAPAKNLLQTGHSNLMPLTRPRMECKNRDTFASQTPYYYQI